jgi:hypothetical protein
VRRRTIRASIGRSKPGSRLAEGHPQGIGLDSGKAGRTMVGRTTPRRPERPSHGDRTYPGGGRQSFAPAGARTAMGSDSWSSRLVPPLKRDRVLPAHSALGVTLPLRIALRDPPMNLEIAQQAPHGRPLSPSRARQYASSRSRIHPRRSSRKHAQGARTPHPADLPDPRHPRTPKATMISRHRESPRCDVDLHLDMRPDDLAPGSSPTTLPDPEG